MPVTVDHGARSNYGSWASTSGGIYYKCTLGTETDSNQSDGDGDLSLQVQLGLELKMWQYKQTHMQENFMKEQRCSTHRKRKEDNHRTFQALLEVGLY